MNRWGHVKPKKSQCRNDPRNLQRTHLLNGPRKNLSISEQQHLVGSQTKIELQKPEFINVPYDKYFPLGSMCMFLCDGSKNIYSSSFMLCRGFWRYLLHLDGFSGPRYDEHNAEGRVLKVIVHHLMPCKSWESNKSILLDRKGSGFLGYGWFSEILAA